MRVVLLTMGLVALVTAIPTNVDTVVPDEMIEIKTAATAGFSSDADAWNNAQQELATLRAGGKDDKECRKLADDTQKSVDESVKGLQKAVDEVDIGSSCKDKGMKDVEKAEKDKKNADDALVQAEKDKKKAESAPVDFGTFNLDAVKEGDCSVFFGSSNYINAKKKASDTKLALAKAEGAAKEAKESLDTFKKVAKEAQEKCYCEAQKNYAKAMKEGNAANDANDKAYKMSFNLKCILDGTPLDKCTAPKAPRVKGRTLPAEVEGAKCEDEAKSSGGIIMKSDYNNAEVKSVEFQGSATTLTWDILHNICGKKTPGSTRYLDKYCAYSAADDFVVTASCNWANQKFTYVSGSIKKPAYMCAHLHCDHLVAIGTDGKSKGHVGKVTINPGDSVMCGA